MFPDQFLFGVEVLLNGLMAGVLYALVALGFVLIFKASGIFNYAQGVMALFAALTLVGIMDGQVPFSHLINALFGTDVHHFGWHVPAFAAILSDGGDGWISLDCSVFHLPTFGGARTNYPLHGDHWAGLLHGRIWRHDVGIRDQETGCWHSAGGQFLD